MKHEAQIDIEMINLTVSISRMTSSWLIGQSSISSPLNASMSRLLQIKKPMTMKWLSTVLVGENVFLF